MQGGVDGAANTMEVCTMEGYSVRFLIGVAIVAVRSILGGDKVSGSVLSDVYLEYDSDVNLEGVRPGACRG